MISGRSFARPVALAAAVLLLGCTTYPVDTDYDPGVAFDGLRTYAWLPAPPKRTGDPRLDSDLLNERVRRAVDDSLAARGYQKVDVDGADFAVVYHLAIEQKIDVQTYTDYYPRGYRWYGPGQSYTTVREYDVGSLVLDLVDPNERKLIWRGGTQARVAERGTPEEREARIRAAVDAILAKFPPK